MISFLSLVKNDEASVFPRRSMTIELAQAHPARQNDCLKDLIWHKSSPCCRAFGMLAKVQPSDTVIFSV